MADINFIVSEEVLHLKPMKKINKRWKLLKGMQEKEFIMGVQYV